MANEQQFKDAIAEIHTSGKDHTLAEFLFKVWKDKIIEVFIGEAYEDIKWDDSSQRVASVVVGKFIGAYAECLIINSVYVDSKNNMRTGNIICLNERAIRHVAEVDGNGCIADTFLTSADATKIKKLFEGK
jgi:hypothetical protein